MTNKILRLHPAREKKIVTAVLDVADSSDTLFHNSDGDFYSRARMTFSSFATCNEFSCIARNLVRGFENVHDVNYSLLVFSFHFAFTLCCSAHRGRGARSLRVIVLNISRMGVRDPPGTHLTTPFKFNWIVRYFSKEMENYTHHTSHVGHKLRRQHREGRRSVLCISRCDMRN